MGSETGEPRSYSGSNRRRPGLCFARAPLETPSFRFGLLASVYELQVALGTYSPKPLELRLAAAGLQLRPRWRVHTMVWRSRCGMWQRALSELASQFPSSAFNPAEDLCMRR